MIAKRPGLTSLAAALLLSAGLAAPAQAADRSNVYQPVNCNDEDIPCVDVGESRLLRTGDGLVATVTTSRLHKGRAYSLWWLIFNNPDQCATTPCSLDDLANEDAGGAVIWASGGVAGDFGTGQRASGHFTAVLNEGETGEDSDVALEDAETAEVQIIIRSHGRANKNNVGDQTTSLNGGCSVDVKTAKPKKKGAAVPPKGKHKR